MQHDEQSPLLLLSQNFPSKGCLRAELVLSPLIPSHLPCCLFLFTIWISGIVLEPGHSHNLWQLLVAHECCRYIFIQASTGIHSCTRVSQTDILETGMISLISHIFPDTRTARTRFGDRDTVNWVLMKWEIDMIFTWKYTDIHKRIIIITKNSCINDYFFGHLFFTDTIFYTN